VCLVREVRFRWSPHLPQQSPIRRSLERQSWLGWHLDHSYITPFGGSYTSQGSKDSSVCWEHSIIREHDTARRAQDRRAVGIERTEYYARQAAARELARERGFSALVAWSRGGSTQDHYADVYYFTGFYTHQPFIPDESGRWRAHGHTALVLPVDGPGTLLMDMTELQDPKPAADSLRYTEDLVESLATTVAATVPCDTDVALLGGEALAWRWGRELGVRLTEHRIIEADDLAAELRLIKSEAELDLLRCAGEIGARAVDAAMEAAVPEITEAEVAAAAISEIVRSGGALYGLGLSSGPWAHTFSPSTPAAYSRRRLDAGDIIRLDLYGSIDGYLFDFGRSRVVGREATQEQQEILDAVKDSVQAGTEFLRPGETLGTVAQRCEESLGASSYARRHGLPWAMGGTWGHSLGLDWGSPWIESTSSTVIRPGMCFAIERRIEAPGIGGANYENNVIVTDTGPEIVTPASDRYGE
jgi:Xaa-Pro aminopeptidase